jgi:hypothetical protein
MCANHRQEWDSKGMPRKIPPACPNEPMKFHIYCRSCFVALLGYYRKLR